METLEANLPALREPLIGRETDIAEVVALLARDAVRLVTLTGPAGVGKTRLALAVAGLLRTAFEDGIWFVPLETIQDPAQVAPTIAGLLGVPETAGQAW